MLKGVFVGVGIMIVAFLIPILHFISGPLGPFIAGYFAISFVPDRGEHYAVRSVKYGVGLGMVWALASGIAALLVTWLAGPSIKAQILMWIGVSVITLYTGSMATLGAMYATLRSQRNVTPTADAEQ